MQKDGRPSLFLKATATEALWAMEGLNRAFGRRVTSPPAHATRTTDTDVRLAS
jgi:hypothetical protein